jgi:hypothetical protein
MSIEYYNEFDEEPDKLHEDIGIVIAENYGKAMSIIINSYTMPEDPVELVESIYLSFVEEGNTFSAKHDKPKMFSVDVPGE